MNSVSHIGIILDGNRRFAKKLMKQPWKGHEWGAQKVEKLFDWCTELGVKELTLYAFSMQNFNRPKQEFDYLMQLFQKFFTKLENDGRLEKQNIRVNFIGRIHLFPQELYQKMLSVMKKTKDNKTYTVNFALAYGGQEEIVDAVKQIGRDLEAGKITADTINKEIIEKNLYISSQPDLIIRTGGEQRTSNFLVWQSWYSEWFFLEKTWPEFEREDLVTIITQFKGRERRFGK